MDGSQYLRVENDGLIKSYYLNLLLLLTPVQFFLFLLYIVRGAKHILFVIIQQLMINRNLSLYICLIEFKSDPTNKNNFFEL